MKRLSASSIAACVSARARSLRVLLPSLAASALLFPAAALAQSGSQDSSAGFVDKIQAGVNTTAHPSGLDVNNNLMFMIGSTINVALSLVGVLLVGYLVYAGFLYMTAGGEEKNITKAKGMIKNAVIGLIILAASFAIARFVLQSITRVTQGS